jgi:hypothetical protein
MPSHTHYIDKLNTTTDGDHKHTWSGYDNSTDATHGSDISNWTHHTTSTKRSPNTSSNGDHYHKVSGNTNPKGGNDSIDNRPAYYALVYIMKL